MSSVHVSWTCSNEFDATEQQSISFVSDDSFVKLQRTVAQTGEKFVNFHIRVGMYFSSKHVLSICLDGTSNYERSKQWQRFCTTVELILLA